MGSFANNDVEYEDETGGDHDSFGYGLKKSLFNYMHNIGIDEPLQKWFDEKVPKTKVSPSFIENALNENEMNSFKPNSKIIFLANIPAVEYFTQSKKGNSREMATLTFINKRSTQQIQILKQHADWFLKVIPLLFVTAEKQLTLLQLKENYEGYGLEDFEIFWDNKPMNTLYQSGLLVV